MFDPWNALVNLIQDVLVGTYDVCGDWGLSVIVLAIIVRVLIMPLAVRDIVSSIRLRELQPELDELKERYADDRELLQRKVSAFYTEHKVNPLNGCLTVFLQMPVFFALFSVVRNVGVLSSGASSAVGASSALPTVGASPTASFYNVVPDLAASAAEVAPSGNVTPYAVLAALFGVLTLVSYFIGPAADDARVVRLRRIVGVMVSAWMCWIGWRLPAGVLLYYSASVAWQLVFRQVVSRCVSSASDEAYAS
jgi:YidC/Oxa1 family membrane protein insertase